MYPCEVHNHILHAMSCSGYVFELKIKTWTFINGLQIKFEFGLFWLIFERVIDLEQISEIWQISKKYFGYPCSYWSEIFYING